MIKIGTSGYSYEDWEGRFYPAGTEKGKYLQFYSRVFNVTEVNSTYYHVPRPGLFRGMLKKVPQDFRFSVKLSSQFTHQREEAEKFVAPFKRGIRPLLQDDRLLTLLAQFPYSFKPTADNFRHLERLRDYFPHLPINVEFRNDYWLEESTFEFLRENDLGYVAVDAPPLPHLPPPLARVTSELAYVRFHGRVREHWWNPPQPHMRYDYLYSEGELDEWVPRLRELEENSSQLLIFFNNHFGGKSARNALTLAQKLGRGPPATVQEPAQVELPLKEEGRLL